MEPENFQEQLEGCIGRKLKLRINDNKSTMLSVKWEADCTRVSLHRMFLQAPHDVMSELISYLRREVKKISPSINRFIESSLQSLDYSHTVNPHCLYVKGEYYNLDEIYQNVNREYFDGAVDLKITWFGRSQRRRRQRFTMGLYHDHLKLIKIHRFLDSSVVPEYIVSYVIYHEMLHHVSPPYYDEKGKHRIHSKEFKQLEKQYKHYKLAKEWIRENQTILFY